MLNDYRKWMILTGIGIGSLLLESGYTGTGGRVGFCVYSNHAPDPEQQQTYVVEQGGGLQCFYQAGEDGSDDTRLTYPKEPGTILDRIRVTRAGLNCTTKTWHYEQRATFFDGCLWGNGYSNVAMYSEDDKVPGAIEFNFGSGSYWRHSMALYRASSHSDTKRFDLSTLQLSTTPNGLSGVAEVFCPHGWCTTGEPRGSTIWVMWSPGNNLPSGSSLSVTSKPARNTAKPVSTVRE